VNPVRVSGYCLAEEVKPYFEIEGGTLFEHESPEATSQVNLRRSARWRHILGEKHNWSAEVRFMHISNAG